jgi:hypothetical protein
MEYIMHFSGHPLVRNINGTIIIAAKQKAQFTDSTPPQIAAFVQPATKLPEQELQKTTSILLRTSERCVKWG